MILSGVRSAVAALLATFTVIDAQRLSAGPPWNHALFTTSPPVYPSPNATGLEWEAAFAQAAAFVSQLTLEEKVGLVTGTPGPCVGNIAPIARLNFTGLCLQDGPLAIRQADYASVFPAGLTIAATWDKSIAHRRGYEMGSEFVGKGANVALGPVAGPLGRSAYAGRNWEGFSPDPYLTGMMMEETIVGMQKSGIQATAKHYIGNEQETQRNPSISANGTTIEAVSANIDDRTLHELYGWPFQNAVRAGVSSVMCSYNRVNASYSCQNSKLLNGVLKEEWGFQGYVMSDWGGTHSGPDAVNAGEDMDMPGTIGFVPNGPSFWGANLTTALNNGSVTEDRIDDMCRRVLTPYYRLNQNSASYPRVDPSEVGLNSLFFVESDYDYNYTFNAQSNVDVRDHHGRSIREQGAAGIVLLKNTNGTLPLKAPKNVGVFGNDAGDLTNGLYFIGFGSAGQFEYGVQAAGGGSGTGRFSYIVPPLDAIKERVGYKHNLVQYVLNNSAIVEGGALGLIYPTPPEVCLVFLKTWAQEGFDRTTLNVDWDGNAVVSTVASQCPNTVVITNSGGINVLPFADNPNVTAILAAHYSGEEVGNSIVDVLYGDVNPSGHLPYTIAFEQDDYVFADITNSTALVNTNNPNAWQSDFKERLLIDYRHFDYYNESVRYEFGYGLSYTTFSMGNLTINSVARGALSALPPKARTVPGGNPHLWDVVYRVTASVTNTGAVAGAAVPQLYLGLPQPAHDQDTTPTSVLRGFEKVTLAPGQSATVAFELTRRDLSYWDIYGQDWTIAPGAVRVMAGFSSRDFRATGSFTPLSAGGYGYGHGHGTRGG